MPKSKTIECFIPALALEHPANEENYTLRDKLCAAVNRFIHTGSFSELITVQDDTPYVFIENTVFNPVDLGYYVRAKI